MSRPSRYPDFFIVGAQRSGTTSLYEYLRLHSGVFMSPHKETHYFSQDRVRVDADLVIQSQDAYLQLFVAGGDKMLGEASPSYLWHPEAAQRIHAKQPNGKIIATLRNPIARAFSQYQMDLADGLPAIPFYDALVQDDRRTDKVYGTGHLYVELGFYAEQLSRYYDVFGPERVLVLAFEELSQNTRATLGRVAAFLGIAPGEFEQTGAYEVHNRNAVPASRLMRDLLQHRALRRTYRSVIPAAWRTSMRKRVFTSHDVATLDERSFEYLQTRYLPGAQALQDLCSISFPDLVPKHG